MAVLIFIFVAIFSLICFDFGLHCYKSALVIYLTMIYHQSLSSSGNLNATRLAFIFTKISGTSWCTLSKNPLSLIPLVGAVKQAMGALFFNTSATWQDWVKLHYYVLHCEKMACRILPFPPVFGEQASLFLHYYYDHPPVPFFQHHCLRTANCDVKHSLSACLSWG